MQTWPVAMSVAVVAEPLPVEGGPGESTTRHPDEAPHRGPRESGDPGAAAATSLASRVRGNDGAGANQEAGVATAATSVTAATSATVGAPPAAPAFAPASSGAGSLGGAVVALLLVVGLILGLAWLARRMPGVGAAAAGNRNLKLVGSLSIGPRERVVVVDVGGTQLLLSTGAGGTRTLHTLEQPLPETQSAPASPFAQVLAQHFGKNR